MEDSVTQGRFELYRKGKNSFETEFKMEYAYSNCLKKILSVLFPKVSINIVNAGINGDNTSRACKRIKDVLSHRSDKGMRN